jgi:hypothetical protein
VYLNLYVWAMGSRSSKSDEAEATERGAAEIFSAGGISDSLPGVGRSNHRFE